MELVRIKVETGLYNSASEFVREALRLLEERDRIDRLRAAIAIVQDAFARRETTIWTEDTMDELIRRADEAERLGLPMVDDALPSHRTYDGRSSRSANVPPSRALSGD